MSYQDPRRREPVRPHFHRPSREQFWADVFCAALTAYLTDDNMGDEDALDRSVEMADRGLVEYDDRWRQRRES